MVLIFAFIIVSMTTTTFSLPSSQNGNTAGVISKNIKKANSFQYFSTPWTSNKCQLKKTNMTLGMHNCESKSVEATFCFGKCTNVPLNSNSSNINKKVCTACTAIESKAKKIEFLCKNGKTDNLNFLVITRCGCSDIPC